METRPDNRSAAIALNLMQGFSPRVFRRAVEAFTDLADLFGAGDGALEGCGVTSAAAAELRRTDPAKLAAGEEERAARGGARLVTWFDEEYPILLRHIYDPPPVLYLRGPLDLTRLVSVAVVGSRKPTPYGTEVAVRIGRELARGGCNVVSGLAAGIDAAAHWGALEDGGMTTAVYGCGLDVTYPAQNRPLAEKIAASGVCLSEFPLGTRPEKYTFPRRNRVISGLAVATVVVEAGEKSGALITADFALEQGREVYAVPGRVGQAECEGCHRLLRDGARLFQRVDDLLDDLGPWLKDRPPRRKDDGGAPGPALTGDERALLDCFAGDPLYPDELIGITGLTAPRAAAALLVLEMRGLVRQLPGKRFLRTMGDH